MAFQSERVPGGLVMSFNVESMVQHGNPEQDIPVQEQVPPQTDPEPEMGAAAVAADDTPPPLPRQNPSLAPSETTTDNGGSVLLGQLTTRRVIEMMR